MITTKKKNIMVSWSCCQQVICQGFDYDMWVFFLHITNKTYYLILVKLFKLK